MFKNEEVIRQRRYREILAEAPILYEPVKNMEIAEDDTAANVTNHVLAPCMASFVLWVLSEAMRSKKERLYFLARDGYLMYETAKIFCRYLNLPIRCCYLSCSRYALRIPLFHLNQEEALDCICQGGIDITLEKILNRAGLSRMEQQDIIKELDINDGKQKIIPYSRLAEIRGALKENQRFMEYMCLNSRKALSAAQGYFRQEGLLDSVAYAIVDSGWVGSVQKSLDQFIQIMGGSGEVEGYYWGLYDLPAAVGREKYHCFYFSPGTRLKAKVYFCNCLYEAVFTAPHGMTLGYKKEGEIYIPHYGIIEKRNKQFAEQMKVNTLQYAESLIRKIVDLESISSNTHIKVLEKLLSLLMVRPTAKEVELYGNLMFSDDVLETVMQPVAAALNTKELSANHVLNKLLIMTGLKKGAVKESAWYEGSALRGGQNIRYHQKQYLLYKYLLYIKKTYLWRKNNG